MSLQADLGSAIGKEALRGIPPCYLNDAQQLLDKFVLRCEE